jgi:hypothetical protein
MTSTQIDTVRGVTSPAAKQIDPATRKALARARRKKVVKVPAKTVKAKAAKKQKVTRGEGPSGRVAEILKLASRAQGASRDELNALTKWKGAPWKWLFSNPKKSGYCDRWGYRLRVEEGKNGEARYHVTKR